MVARKHIVAGVVLVAVGIVAAVCLLESDTTKVKKQFAKLSELVSKHGEEPILQMARKAQAIGALFARECTLATPVYDFSGKYDRAEIVSNAARMRAQLSTLSLVFTDITVEFPDAQTARVVATVTLKGNAGTGDPLNETREFECSLIKVDRKWLFASWNVVDVLKK